MRTHLDGAAGSGMQPLASGVPLAQWSKHFDTVNVCFSKGLWARRWFGDRRAGDLIREAVRHRKVVGGGMRQIGIIAAAALYALENHIGFDWPRTHANARKLADGLRQIPGVRMDCDPPDTNLVFIPSRSRAADGESRWSRGLLARSADARDWAILPSAR